MQSASLEIIILQIKTVLLYTFGFKEEIPNAGGLIAGLMCFRRDLRYFSDVEAPLEMHLFSQK